jgi:hypothetical protein
MSGPGSRLYVSEEEEPETFDFYIGPSGSDSNNGLTTSTPWAITALNTKRATYGGFTVGIMDGTYDCSGMPNYALDGSNNPYPIFQIQGGTSGALTVIKAVNARQAIIELKTGGGVRNVRPAMGQYGSQGSQGYITIDGLVFQGGGMWGMSWWGAVATGGRVGWKPGVTIKNCHFRDFFLNDTDNEPAIWFDKCTGPVVQNCKFEDITDASANGYGPCAVMTLSVRGLVFEYNTVFDTRCPIHDKHNNGDDYASDGFVIRNNYFYNNTQYLIIGMDTEYRANAPDDTYQECVVHNNVAILSEGGWYCKSGSATRMSVTFYNNTFVQDAALDSGFMGTMATTSDLFSFYNNIIERSGFGNSGWDYAVSTGAFGTIDYNMLDSTIRLAVLSPIDDTSWSGTSYTTLATWRAATTADDNSIQATPVFVGGAGAAGYALDTGSPGLNAGKVGGTSGGATRHMGAWDGVVTQIGCDF